jgi:hypothetical protein
MGVTKADGRPLRLAGIAEAAVVYEADKSLVRRILSRAGAPQPIDTLASGPVYDRDELEEHAATRSRRIGRPMTRHFPSTMRIPDDDPLWSNHDGGTGHDGPEWRPGDSMEALSYWAALDSKGQNVLAYLIAHRGRLITHNEIVEQLRLDPGGTKRAASVMAGALSRMGAANEAAGRCFPYRWWKKTPEGTVYAVKHEVAEIFDASLKHK